DESSCSESLPRTANYLFYSDLFVLKKKDVFLEVLGYCPKDITLYHETKVIPPDLYVATI
ncbi:11041_t:CDS:2, partial [Funneliformis mosseae]